MFQCYDGPGKYRYKGGKGICLNLITWYKGEWKTNYYEGKGDLL